MAWWDSRQQQQQWQEQEQHRSLSVASIRPKKRLILGDAFPRLDQPASSSQQPAPAPTPARLTMDQERALLSPVFDDYRAATSTPPLVVHVEIRFTDPVIRSRYFRSYGSSPALEPSRRLCNGLLRRIERCSHELLTRKDSGALEPLRDDTKESKPLRFDMTFRIMTRGAGEWAERAYRSYQKQPLTVALTKDIILATHKMVGLYLRRHDKYFRWIDQPFYDMEPENPETTVPTHGGPLSLACIPRSRFIESSQSFEAVPGYRIELSFESRNPQRKEIEFQTVVKANSKQTAPLTLFMSEDLLWRALRAVNEGLEPRKRAFDDHLKDCLALDCHHADDDALSIELRITNNLGPVYSQVRRTITSKLSLFRDSEAKDCDEFLKAAEAALVDACQDTDAKINAMDDFELRILELKGVGWTLSQPAKFTVNSSASYSRRTIQAALDRVQTGISDVLRGRNVAVHISAHKRGHTVLDKAIVAHEKRGGMKEMFASPEEESSVLIARLKTRIRSDIDMVFEDTCLIDDMTDDGDEEGQMLPFPLAGTSGTNDPLPNEQCNPVREQPPAKQSGHTQSKSQSLPRPQPSSRRLVQRAFSLTHSSSEPPVFQALPASVREGPPAETSVGTVHETASPPRPQSSSRTLVQRALSLTKRQSTETLQEPPGNQHDKSKSLPRQKSSVRRLVRRAFSLSRRSTESLWSKNFSKLAEHTPEGERSRPGSVAGEQDLTRTRGQRHSLGRPMTAMGLVEPAEATESLIAISKSRSTAGRVSNASTLIDELAIGVNPLDPTEPVEVGDGRVTGPTQASETEPAEVNRHIGESAPQRGSERLCLTVPSVVETDDAGISAGIDLGEPAAAFDANSTFQTSNRAKVTPCPGEEHFSGQGTGSLMMDTDDALERAPNPVFDEVSKTRSLNPTNTGEDEGSTAPSTPALSTGGDSSPRASVLITPRYLRRLSGARDSIAKEPEPEPEALGPDMEAETDGQSTAMTSEGEDQSRDILELPQIETCSPICLPQTTNVPELTTNGPEKNLESALLLGENTESEVSGDGVNSGREEDDSPLRTLTANSEQENNTSFINEVSYTAELGAELFAKPNGGCQGANEARPDFPTPEVRNSAPTDTRLIARSISLSSSEPSSGPFKPIDCQQAVGFGVGSVGGVVVERFCAAKGSPDSLGLPTPETDASKSETNNIESLHPVDFESDGLKIPAVPQAPEIPIENNGAGGHVHDRLALEAGSESQNASQHEIGDILATEKSETSSHEVLITHDGSLPAAVSSVSVDNGADTRTCDDSAGALGLGDDQDSAASASCAASDIIVGDHVGDDVGASADLDSGLSEASVGVDSSRDVQMPEPATCGGSETPEGTSSSIRGIRASSLDISSGSRDGEGVCNSSGPESETFSETSTKDEAEGGGCSADVGSVCPKTSAGHLLGAGTDFDADGEVVVTEDAPSLNETGPYLEARISQVSQAGHDVDADASSSLLTEIIGENVVTAPDIPLARDAVQESIAKLEKTLVLQGVEISGPEIGVEEAKENTSQSDIGVDAEKIETMPDALMLGPEAVDDMTNTPRGPAGLDVGYETEILANTPEILGDSEEVNKRHWGAEVESSVLEDGTAEPGIPAKAFVAPLADDSVADGSGQRLVLPEISVKEFTAPLPDEPTCSLDKALTSGDLVANPSTLFLESNVAASANKTAEIPVTQPADHPTSFNPLLLFPFPVLSAWSNSSSIPDTLGCGTLPSARSSVDSYRVLLSDEEKSSSLSSFKNCSRPQTAGYLGLHRESPFADFGLRGALGDTHRSSFPALQAVVAVATTEEKPDSLPVKGGTDKKHGKRRKIVKAQPQEDGDDGPMVLSRIMLLLAGAMAINKVLKGPPPGFGAGY
ncbi:hypothetical protein B0T26DRAFT_670378 [Lasiosphaeria miniovina]|uniref:Pt repeat family protein n=1 Tax=Lasiosphaeria miniovina TaxID=1954250 RepID=A0AA40EG64_9PEZI|nr:uncharacterized protein B0T26DRAFT_670378 [Lasiosphaeria miniovina]KAK0734043.1 hypothetical protein B0T26DRAFT_670378 [Lasiosphaeria miniovina]